MRGEQSKAWSIWRRIVAGLVVLFLGAGGLGLAGLEPDPRGFGTHQQLGFPGCTLRTLFGIPCPGCGVTTSLALFARGRIVESAVVQPVGFALGMVLMGVAAWLTLSAGFGRSVVIRRPETLAAWVAVGLAVLAMIVWLIRLI
jgi:hypothetical protein